MWPQFPATLGALQNNRGPTQTMGAVLKKFVRSGKPSDRESERELERVKSS